MENLARSKYDKQVDEKVKEKLLIAKVPVLNVGGVIDHEVKTRYIGVLHGFVFKRAWNYWVVKGWMPMEHAKYIYENYKHCDIRAGGDAGNVSPEEPYIYSDPAYEKKLDLLLQQMGRGNLLAYMEKAKEIEANPEDPKFIKVYHVDTQLGLCKLAEVIRQFDIHTEFAES